MYGFLAATLGTDGADALEKAMLRAPEIRDALLLKVATAWYELNAQNGFDGVVPGTEIHLKLLKNDGAIDGIIAGAQIQVPSAEIPLLIATAVEGKALKPNPNTVKGLDSTVKLLAKAQYATIQIAKKAPKVKIFSKDNSSIYYSPLSKSYSVVTKDSNQDFFDYKQARAFLQQIAKTPAPKAFSGLRKLKKSITLTDILAKSSGCPSCGQDFVRDSMFSGCLCIRDYVGTGVVCKKGNSVIIKTAKLDEDEILSIKSVFRLDK